MACAHGSFIGPSKSYPGATTVIRGDCRKLSCPRCGPKKAKRYRAAIARLAGENKLQRCMTLTLDPAKIPADQDSISYIRECWAEFRVYIARKFGKGVFRYIAMLELTKAGIAHLHILIPFYIPKQWISETWSNVGGGFIVGIRFTDIQHVASYLTKYVTKELLLLIPWKKKRITTSRNIHLFSHEKLGFIRVLEGINLLKQITSGRIFDEVSDEVGLASFCVIETGG